MLLQAVKWLYTLLRNRARLRVRRIMNTLYDDPEDRSLVYLSEGAEIASTFMFGEGEPLKGLVIMPEDDGYHISVFDEVEEYEN